MIALAALVVVAAHFDGQPLTADRAVAIALEESPLIAIDTAVIAEENAPTTLGMAFPNPELRVGYDGLDRPFRDAPSKPLTEDIEIGVRVAVPPLMALGPEQVRVHRAVASAEATREGRREWLAAEVRKAHAELVNLDAQIALGQEEVALMARLKEMVRSRADANVATSIDESLAALEHFDSLTELERLRAEERIARQSFSLLIGVPLDDTVRFAPDTRLRCAPPAKPLDELLRTALASAPELRARDEAIAAEEAAMASALADRLPWPEWVELGYKTGAIRNEDQVRIGASIPIPIFDWNQDEIRERRAVKEQLLAERRQAELEVDARVRRHVADLNGHAAVVTLFDGASSPVIDEGLARVEEAAALGEGDPVDLVDVTTRALKARRQRLRALLECEKAAIELAQVAGEVVDSVGTP